MQTKKIPVRMCSGCGQHFPKKELVRVVRSPQGEISVDLTGKKSGRGAYICPACLNDPALLKKRPLDRAFRQKVPEGVYAALADAREGKA